MKGIMVIGIIMLLCSFTSVAYVNSGIKFFSIDTIDYLPYEKFNKDKL